MFDTVLYLIPPYDILLSFFIFCVEPPEIFFQFSNSCYFLLALRFSGYMIRLIPKTSLKEMFSLLVAIALKTLLLRIFVELLNLKELIKMKRFSLKYNVSNYFFTTSILFRVFVRVLRLNQGLCFLR